MLAEGVIVKVTEPTEWCSPMVTVRKKNGQLRICTDFRQLNHAVERELFQIPTFEDITAMMQGATVFSLLDCSSGYWQLPVEKESQPLLTFTSPFGRFSYTRLPFGLKSAPEIFQRVMSQILSDLPGVTVYIDDILIFATSEGEHKHRLEAVLRRLEQEGITLNRDKCSIGMDSVEYLGHVLSSKGIEPSPKKTEAVINAPVPTSKEQLRSFLGLTTYVGQKFVPHYASIVEPLWKLCAEASEFVWDGRSNRAFEEVKDATAKVTNLVWFDHRMDVTVQVDASGSGLGAVLLQNGRPIMYASRKLTAVESRYSQLEREFLALVFGVKRFRKFIIGCPCVMETDHLPILRLRCHCGFNVG